eukprot:TRINITY_DN1958_c0_g1_i2.p1 TRINITY_DN1958_c0_g1~~TRINITY_DN1958_c0_g1_i2.p1  ORF type:complete len:280 (-),score=19.85 TRINITY_DN1958_c0_g1_i2:251-1030(-)
MAAALSTPSQGLRVRQIFQSRVSQKICVSHGNHQAKPTFTAIRCAGGKKSREETEFVDTRIHYSSPEEGWIGHPSAPWGDSNGVMASTSSSPVVPPHIDNHCLTEIEHRTDSLYRALGLDPYAEQGEIIDAYRVQTKRLLEETEVVPSALLEARFLDLKNAYAVLSNPLLRTSYDHMALKEQQRREWSAHTHMHANDGHCTAKIGNSASLVPQSHHIHAENIPLKDEEWAGLAFDLFAVLLGLCFVLLSYIFKVNTLPV